MLMRAGNRFGSVGANEPEAHATDIIVTPWITSCSVASVKFYYCDMVSGKSLLALSCSFYRQFCMWLPQYFCFCLLLYKDSVILK